MNPECPDIGILTDLAQTVRPDVCEHVVALRQLQADTKRVESTGEESGEETDEEYFSRMRQYWSEHFKSAGHIHLLPHHFLRMWDDLNTHISLSQQERHSKYYSQAHVLEHQLHIANPVLAIDFSEIASRDTRISYTHTYQQDIKGVDTTLFHDYYLNRCAISLAIIDTPIPIAINHNPFQDPMCTLARIFGTGTHCRASFLAKVWKPQNVPPRTDLLSLDWMIDFLEKRREQVPVDMWEQLGITWKKDDDMSIYTELILPHQTAASHNLIQSMYYSCPYSPLK